MHKKILNDLYGRAILCVKKPIVNPTQLELWMVLFCVAISNLPHEVCFRQVDYRPTHTHTHRGRNVKEKFFVNFAEKKVSRESRQKRHTQAKTKHNFLPMQTGAFECQRYGGWVGHSFEFKLLNQHGRRFGSG